MIIKKTESEFNEFSLEGDQFKILKAEKIPEGLLRANYIARQEKGLKYMDKDKEWHWVARIPKIVFNQLMRDHREELINPDSKFLYQWLDRPENYLWKTFMGRAS